MLLNDDTLRGDLVWEGEGNLHAGPFFGTGGLGFTVRMAFTCDAPAVARQFTLADVGHVRMRDMVDALPVFRASVPRPQEIAGMPASGRNACAIAASKTNPGVVAQMVWRRLLLSENKGDDWFLAPGLGQLGDEDANDKSSNTARYFNKLEFDPTNDDVIYVTQPKTGVAHRYIRSTQEFTQLSVPDPGTVNVLCPIIDQTSPIVNGRHSRGWMIVGTTAIYESVNLGASNPTWTDALYPAAAINDAICDDTGRLIVCDGAQSFLYTKTAGNPFAAVASPRKLQTICQKPGDPTKFYGRAISNDQGADVYFPNANFTGATVRPNANTRRHRTGYTPLTAVSAREQVSVARAYWHGDKIYLCTGWGIETLDVAQLAAAPAIFTWDTADNFGVETLVNRSFDFAIGPDGEDVLFLTNMDRALIKQVLPGDGRYGPTVLHVHRQSIGSGVSQALDNPSVFYGRVWAQSTPAGDLLAKSTDAGETWDDKPNTGPELSGITGKCVAGNEGTVLCGNQAGGWPQITFDDRVTFEDIEFFASDAEAAANASSYTRTPGGSFFFAQSVSFTEYVERDPDQPGRFFIYSWGGAGIPCGLFEIAPGTKNAVLRVAGANNAYIPTTFSRGYHDILRYDPVSKYLYHCMGSMGSAYAEDANVPFFRINTLTWAVDKLTVPNEPYNIDVGAPLREGDPMTLWLCGAWAGNQPALAFSRDCGTTIEYASLPEGVEVAYVIAASKRVFGLVALGLQQSGARLGRWMDVLGA